MEIKVEVGSPMQAPRDLVALGIFEEDGVPGALGQLVVSGDFKGKPEETLLLYPQAEGGPKRVLLIGLGKVDEVKPDALRRAGAIAVRRAQSLQTSAFSFSLPRYQALNAPALAQGLAEGIVLGDYRYLRFRTALSDEQKFEVTSATIHTSAENESAVREGVTTGQVVAAGVLTARELVNTPGADKTPPVFANDAVRVGAEHGFSVTVLDDTELEAQGFGGIMAVGKGSYGRPRFIIMEHGHAEEGKPTVCFVGKGITFDSGGLSLKPADAMETMKNDMGGGAAVIGAMQVVADLNLPIHVVGLVASAENMPSGRSFRPGDILTTLSGKTIEVLNTDAEGRIVLSDALFYAQRYNPAAVIELSTLTGAVIIALGTQTIGLMATDQSLADKVLAAGETSSERCWQLPLWQEYFDMIKSEYADMKNIGGRPAGSITAGAFLANFTNYPFVHLDIAGAAYADKPARVYNSAGGTGAGVRLLVQFLLDNYA